MLRRIYGPGFFLIGVFASEQCRRDYLEVQKGLEPNQATALIERDENENEPYGQRTRDTFQWCDVFVELEGDEYKTGLSRFLSLVFGNPHCTPRKQEYAMFFAYAASLRSGSLARQVGAAVTNSAGDLLAVGCNDVPRPGGGLYWEGDKDDDRDTKRGEDSNDIRKKAIIADTIDRLCKCLPDGCSEFDFRQAAAQQISDGMITEITEYGREVHAEMDAMISCARNGVGLKGTTLYTTTFPCHNCARHIVAAGVQVQPELESERSPLVSIPPCGRGFSRHRGLPIRWSWEGTPSGAHAPRPHRLDEPARLSGYPLAWLLPSRARLRFTWHCHCNPGRHAAFCRRS